MMAKQFLPRLMNYKLDTLCEHYGFVNENAHDALGDITATGRVLTSLIRECVIPTEESRRLLLAGYMDKFRGLSEFINELEGMMSDNNVYGMFAKIVDRYPIRKKYTADNDGIVLADLLHAVRSAAVENGEAYLRDLAANAALSGSQMDILIEKLHKIPIITVHQSKGCEFDTVIFAGADDGTIPSYIATKTGTEREEARVFYVAITRAKKRLILTSVLYRGNSYRMTSRSRYIEKIPREYIQTIRG